MTARRQPMPADCIAGLQLSMRPSLGVALCAPDGDGTSADTLVRWAAAARSRARREAWAMPSVLCDG